MNRRSFFKSLIGVPVAATVARAQVVPQYSEWYDRFGDFLETMNKFITKINQGIFDTKLWAKATDQFRKVERLDAR